MAIKKSSEPEIKKLNEYEHSRLRTEMFLGSRDPHTQVVMDYDGLKPIATEMTWVPALFTAYREVIDNAVDELITHRSGDRLEVHFDEKKMEVQVKDNGRGIPFGIDKESGLHLVTLALSETKAGRNFDDDTRGNSRGLNGVGASVVNFCSEYFKVDIVRDGQTFSQMFKETKKNVLDIGTPMILPAAPRAISGTQIKFKLSKSVFKHMVLPETFIRARVFEIALCYPQLRVYYNGERIQAKGGAEKVLFEKMKPITLEIEEGKFKSTFWLLPNFFENKSEHVHSLVNGIPLFNGGTHIDSFRKNFYTGIIAALTAQSKKRKLSPNRSDLADGMLLYNITEMDAPSFDSQSKTRLINETVGRIINGAMNEEDFFKSVVRRNPDWIETIYERCAERTMKKDAADIAKLSKSSRRQKVEKLSDATSTDRSECILFLGEGDSAISGLNEARNPRIHGGLPLRGKVMNIFGMTARQVFENDALAQIINSIGLTPGARANRHSLRYGKVYIATDADPDGQNIAALLTNFFYSMWPELFDPSKPFLHIFETPLIIAKKNKQAKYWYSDQYSSFDPEKFKGWDITRAKGLAALKRDDWKYVLENEKVIPIVDEGDLSESLSLLFSPLRADHRKDWIGL